MPKSKYKYYKSIINGALYRSTVKNTGVIEGYDKDEGWVPMSGMAFSTLDKLQQNPFITEITEYEALPIDMFQE